MKARRNLNGTFAARVTFVDIKVCLITVSTPISSVFVELRAVSSSSLLADICKKSKPSFFQLKIKQSVQSHLTSCEIKGDLEDYFCWRRRYKVFEKTATRCSTSFIILARRARI